MYSKGALPSVSLLANETCPLLSLDRRCNSDGGSVESYTNNFIPLETPGDIKTERRIRFGVITGGDSCAEGVKKAWTYNNAWTRTEVC